MSNQSEEEVTIDADYAEEIGTLVFESAIMRFVAEQDDIMVQTFQDYVTAKAAQEDFMLTLCEAFPDFEEILLDEMIVLDQELRLVNKKAD